MTVREQSALEQRAEQAIALLCSLIAIPSLSREEQEAAAFLQDFLVSQGVQPQRVGNNMWMCNAHFDSTKPTLLLNSHIDTVRANKDWTRDPHSADVEAGRLYGLGSNDAGASLVSYAAVFLHFFERNDLHFNLVYAPSAEEEISGAGGISSLLAHLPPINAAFVGEPTQMQMATAEKGLMVLRCTARGKSGHAARNEGVNAIDIAMRDIAWLHSYRFDKESSLLGPIKMTTTMISAGTQHNVVPDQCQFTVDVRTTDQLNNDETLAVIQKHLQSEISEVSKRLQPSRISSEHLIVQAAKSLGVACYGSPTLSDQALLSVPSVKIGPGDSARSHTADEYVQLDEISEGIAILAKLLETMNNMMATGAQL